MTIALQVGNQGVSWCIMPAALNADEGTVVEHTLTRWPRTMPGFRGTLPEDMEQRLVSHVLVREIVQGADHILFAYEDDIDRRLLGALDMALEVPGCHVEEVEPQTGGAAAILNDHIREFLENLPPPPGM